MSIDTARPHAKAAPQSSDAPVYPAPATMRLDESKLLKFDPIRFKEGMKVWAGSMRAQLLAEGYSSTSELMDDLRGRE